MKPTHTLIGFVLVACAIGVAEWLTPVAAPADVIEITPAYRQFVLDQVQQPAGALPQTLKPDEALDKAIEEEVLYREGIKLGLEKDDLIVKRRVVQKMRFMLEDMTPVAEPSDAQLQTWLDKHPDQYQTGRRLTLTHLFFSRGKRGDHAIYDAQQLRVKLLEGQTLQSLDVFPLDTLHGPVDEATLVRELGSTLTQAILDLPLNTWSEPMNSAMGVHLVRVEARDGGHTMLLKEARERVRVDLMSAQREAVNAASVAALKSKYRIHEVKQ
ncbi:peptidylprolyl isomerase [Limnobacter humi]|uniref:Peptidylprolyl isomerase n=1 Tax=Limnobacter humi TaxID=1778671 RepID=A0ABT1WF83_9BURK|nr:peptidylprolyl isomerase [Limnobacter humi]MCQ8896171.1 peptidylprolyl isomerase [Limnobacter humi]